MNKKQIAVLVVMSLLFSVLVIPNMAEASTDGYWKLTGTKYMVGNEEEQADRSWSVSGEASPYPYQSLEAQPRAVEALRRDAEGEKRGSTTYAPTVLRTKWNWSSPAETLRPQQSVSFSVTAEVLEFSQGWQEPTHHISARYGNTIFKIDETDYQTLGLGGQISSSYAMNLGTSGRHTHTLKMENGLPAGSEGQTIWIGVSFSSGSQTVSEQYHYEWQSGSAPSPTPAPEPTPAPQPQTLPQPVAGESSVLEFDSGVRLEWPLVSGLGYRVFRSTNRNDLGISITDFYITTQRIVDVNVEPNTDYHYTVKPVLAEANPLQNVEERLGDTIATFEIRTGNKIENVGQQKGYIILQLDNPIMSVNGGNQEIDPGRGTAPIIISNRSMVPIRAIVEAMGGSVAWDGSESKITLNARGNSVEMWLNRNDIRRNGSSSRMDVAPVSQGGRTYVPVRFASENLDAKADWINSTREVVIVFTE